jgi:hypothetical protein
MRTTQVLGTLVLVTFSGVASAQEPAQPASPQAGPAPNQLTPQVLGEMLRTATTFHQLVQNLNLGKSLGADQHVLGSDGRMHHPLDRTAETIGAGVGAGAAIGAMTRNQNGVLIGALVGGAAGLIADEIVKHREEMKQKALDAPAPEADPSGRTRGFKDRDH